MRCQKRIPRPKKHRKQSQILFVYFIVVLVRNLTHIFKYKIPLTDPRKVRNLGGDGPPKELFAWGRLGRAGRRILREGCVGNRDISPVSDFLIYRKSWGLQQDVWGLKGYIKCVGFLKIHQNSWGFRGEDLYRCSFSWGRDFVWGWPKLAGGPAHASFFWKGITWGGFAWVSETGVLSRMRLASSCQHKDEVK